MNYIFSFILASRPQPFDACQMEYIGPGPIDGSLLQLQHEHISERVWNGQDHVPGPDLDDCMQDLINEGGFGHMSSKITQILIDGHLITALVK